MKIYIGTAGVPISCPKRDTISGIKCIYNLGLNLIEIQFVRGVKMNEDMAKQVGDVANKLGVRLAIHAPYYINLASEKEEVIEKSISDWLYNSIRLASIMGAKCVVFHPASYGSRDPEETYQIVKDSLLRVLEKTKKHDVYICPETMGKIGQFGSVDELMKLVSEIDDPRVVPCFDFAHIHARHGGSLRRVEDFVDILSRYYDYLVKNNLPKYIHIHFSSIEYTEKGEKAHLAIAAREPNFEHFVEALKQFDFDEVEITCESPILEKDAVVMRDILVREGLMEPIKVEPIEIVEKKKKKKTEKNKKATRKALKKSTKKKTKKSTGRKKRSKKPLKKEKK